MTSKNKDNIGELIFGKKLFNALVEHNIKTIRAQVLAMTPQERIDRLKEIGVINGS